MITAMAIMIASAFGQIDCGGIQLPATFGAYDQAYRTGCGVMGTARGDGTMNAPGQVPACLTEAGYSSLYLTYDTMQSLYILGSAVHDPANPTRYVLMGIWYADHRPFFGGYVCYHPMN